MPIRKSLNKIATELDRLADGAADDRPIDPFGIRTAAHRVRAQAEMLDLHLEEGSNA